MVVSLLHMTQQSRLDQVEADLSELEDDLTDLEGEVTNITEVVHMMRRMPREAMPVIDMERRQTVWRAE